MGQRPGHGHPRLRQGHQEATGVQGKVIYYTQEELDQLLLAAGRHRIAIPNVLGAYAGMGRAEIYNAEGELFQYLRTMVSDASTKQETGPRSSLLELLVVVTWLLERSYAG